MKKSMKTLGVLACVGVLGFGTMGNTVMAAEQSGEGDSKVFYISDSSNIDKDGKVVMVIPKDVNLNKSRQKGETELKLKTANGENFDQFGDTFSAKISVTSQNGGKLSSKTDGNNIEASYQLRNATENKNADWSGANTNDAFATFTKDAKNELVKTLEASVDDTAVKKMEEAPSGTQFSDVLTFKVTEIKGTGLAGIS